MPRNQHNRIRPTLRELVLKHFNAEKERRQISDTDLINEILKDRYVSEKPITPIYVLEGQEFIISGCVMKWNYTNQERKEGVMLSMVRALEPTFTVTATPPLPKKHD